MSALATNMVVAGLFATAVMDIYQRILHAATGIPPTHWGLVGRWFGHMPRGRIMHEAIAKAEPIRSEAVIGWSMHYLIGIGYGVVYVGLTITAFDGPTLLNGFLFGLASVVVPWFLMQPALGLGVMGRKAPNPNIPRYTALAAHCIYGLSLFAGSAIHNAVAA